MTLTNIITIVIGFLLEGDVPGWFLGFRLLKITSLVVVITLVYEYLTYEEMHENLEN